MGKRERAQLEREQAGRRAARSAVYAKLWEDPKYQRLQRRKERLQRDVGIAQWVRASNTPQLEASLMRCLKAIFAYEDAALAAAGLTP